MNEPTIEQLADQDIEPIDEDTLHEQYDEMLRDCYGDVSVCGMEMDCVRILKEMDPTAYRCGFGDWLGTTDVYTEIGGEYFDVDEVNQWEQPWCDTCGDVEVEMEGEVCDDCFDAEDDDDDEDTIVGTDDPDME